RAERREVTLGLDLHGQAVRVPRQADVGPGLLAVEPVRLRESARFGQVQQPRPACFRQALDLRAGDGEPEPERLGQERRRHGVGLPSLRIGSVHPLGSCLSRLTISIAESAASAPLLPPLIPARLRACSTVSVVSTPKITGTSDASPACMIPEAAWPA